MEIKGKVHCFFEQSGTFKNEFIKLGIPAEDYDIQNNFGQTDHTDDLFKEIEDAYDDKPSLFDSITADDLIIAFFPCIYFCENNELYFTGKHMPGIKGGICSEDRSMISPDYARNFICDFIIGKSQPDICPTLFD